MIRLDLSREGLYCYLPRDRTHFPPHWGFVIKPAPKRTFSERAGRWRGFLLGPLYFRTYHGREKASMKLSPQTQFLLGVLVLLGVMAGVVILWPH